MGIDPRHQPLAGRFFIAGGTVDLPGKKKISDNFGLQAVRQLGWRKIIVFDGITRAERFKMCKTRDITKSFVLHFFRQGGAEAVDINFDGIPSFGFDKKLMPVPFRKAVEFVFDAWTITGADPVDPSGKHRAPVKSRFQYIMDRWIGIGDPATSLLFW